MNRALPQGLLPVPDIAVDSTVLLFALGITLATGLLFGLAPAWRAARADLNTVLKQGGRSALGGQRPWVRHSLVASELALCTVLLIGAGLLVQSLFRLQKVQLGFRPDHLLTFQLAPPPAKYAGQARQWGLYRDVLEAIAALPGVRDASISSGIPLGVGSYTRTPMSATGRSVLPAGAAIPIDWRTVSPGFFRTLGDSAAGRPRFQRAGHAHISHRDYRQPADGAALLGRRRPDREDAPPPGRHSQPDGSRRGGRCAQQCVEPGTAGAVLRGHHQGLALDGRGGPDRRGNPKPRFPPCGARSATWMPNCRCRMSAAWKTGSRTAPRSRGINAVLVGVFAAVALLIAAIGVYGVLAYSVNQRTREIGLRMALGAQQSNVLRLIVSEGMMVGLAGIAAGLAGAYALSRALAALLFGVEARDPLTFAIVAATLMAIALAACLVPAWRGSRIDPIVALREE